MLLQFVDHIAQIQAHIPKASHIPILSSVVSVKPGFFIVWPNPDMGPEPELNFTIYK